MPFKRNPINAEKIDSLARALAQFPRLAWDNTAHSLLERTLDDSANRRSMLPESFLIADELISTATRIVNGLVVNEAAMRRNLSIYGPFAGTERVLMALSKAGADRQAMHERLRELAMSAWRSVELGRENPLTSMVSSEPDFLEFLSDEQIITLLDANKYLGNAPDRAKEMSQSIREMVG
jgi:adenylosuccinate lyase